MGWLVSPGLASVYVNQRASKSTSLSIYDQLYRHTICLAKIVVALHFFENEKLRDPHCLFFYEIEFYEICSAKIPPK